jgi:alkylation response protein AidB-like acyl-CoA dehydrogenase
MDRALYEPEHEAYRGSVRELLAAEVVPHYEDWRTAGIVPRELFTALGRIGALGFAAPERHGGNGVDDFRYNAVLQEEAAACFVAPAVLGPVLQADICLPYFVGTTTDEQRCRWLPGITSGRLVTAIAMTEPGTGSDLAGIRTRAELDGDTYVVDGAKTFITNGVNADLVVVVVRTGPDPHGGLSLLVVESGTPGFERGRALRKLGLRAQDTAELHFTGARVPAANLLGPAGSGFACLMRGLAQERLSIAVGAVAQARAALATTVEYVRERTAFGSPLSSYQALRHRLAELDTELDVAQQFLDRCILLRNAGQLDPVDAAKAKWWCTEAQGRIVDACVQLHGGYGFMDEYAVARAFADGRASRIYGGTTEIMKEIVGRALLA